MLFPTHLLGCDSNWADDVGNGTSNGTSQNTAASNSLTASGRSHPLSSTMTKVTTIGLAASDIAPAYRKTPALDLGFPDGKHEGGIQDQPAFPVQIAGHPK